ncbi:MAG: GGDEF domain-containing protein [Lachnospiraceae bacterium]|nr:GGDEF domain-containing protein [Lachnospiraceae bacterium]
MITKIRDILKKPSEDNGVSDNLLYLSRILLIVFIIYTMAIGILSHIEGVLIHGVLSFAFTVLFAVCLFLTYKSRIKTLATMICCLLLVYIFIFTIGYGWRASFQQMIIVCIFLFWYDITRSTFMKVMLSAFAGILLCVISALTPTLDVFISSDTDIYRLIIYTNILLSIICLCIIAYFYCTQFADAERKLYLYNKELKKISETDPLTKLPNRRYAIDELKEIEDNYEENGNLVSIAIGDIDFFKNVNDTFGHDAGDEVLSSLSALFNEYMQDLGFVARWGGEEFLFVFKHSNGDEAYLALDTLRDKVSHTEFRFGEETMKVTITFGVEEYGPRAGVDETIAAADKKLYRGKEGGRNRVVY